MSKKQIIIGLGGVATVGKDTFFSLLQQRLASKGRIVTRFAFADNLKKEVESILWSQFGFDVWKLTPEEKKIVRPLLVWWGCTKRHLKADYWIKSVEKSLLSDLSSDVKVVTDARFENEADWVHSLNGRIVHITRTIYSDTLQSHIHVPPANEEETANDPKVKSKADFFVNWPTVLPERRLAALNDYIDEVANYIELELHD